MNAKDREGIESYFREVFKRLTDLRDEIRTVDAKVSVKLGPTLGRESRRAYVVVDGWHYVPVNPKDQAEMTRTS